MNERTELMRQISVVNFLSLISLFVSLEHCCYSYLSPWIPHTRLDRSRSYFYSNNNCNSRCFFRPTGEIVKKNYNQIIVTNGKNTAFQEAIDDRSGDDVFQFDCNSINLILNELNITESPHQLIKYGLTKAQATERLSAYGMNAIPSQPRKNWIDLFFEQFDDRLVQILLFVASLSAISSISSLISSLPSDGNVDDVNILESLVEPLIILLILILNAAVGVWQQLSALESMDALEKFQPRLATVLRSEDRQSNSEWISKFDATNIVPGDIIKIRAGDMIPADVKLLSLDSSVLGVDESCLTGESETVLKVPNADFTTTAITKARSKVPISEQSSMAFSGTTVTQGSAKALVVRTGVKTEIGKIHKGVLSVVDTKTPLGIKLDEFGDNLALIIAFICAAVWVVSIPRFDDPIFPSMFDGALYYAKLGVALGVAAIPEGLPAVVTLVLSLGTRRLADRNVIVRKLPSVETLGCVTVICSDKTGTLTTNQMTAVALLTFDRGHDTRIACIENEIQGSSYEPLGAVVGVDIDELIRYPTGAIQDIISVCFGCNNAELVVKDGKCTVIGEPTEGALLCLGEKLSEVNYQNLDTNTINVNKVQWEKQREKIVTLEFDRDRKSMSVLFSSQTHANGKYNKTSVDVLVKGAPNGLLDRCVNIKLRDGDVVTLTEDIRNEIECAISTLSCRPLRCLLLATRQLKSYTSNPASFRVDYPNFTDVETDLTIVGIVGIKDPVRDDVKKSIKTCKDAGIKVIMISGDAKETSTSIAEELHILEENESTVKAFTANEFFSKNDSEQISILKSGNLVFSRTEPIVKQKIVKMLQSNSEITAMTGDGVNDGPALRQASIGVAMGSGSDVAKEAADMILIDDGFSTIVRSKN